MPCSHRGEAFLIALLQGNVLKDRALVVTLGSASGADVDPHQSSTVVTAARLPDVQASFEAQINQVRKF